jgi:hypothetical protein
MKSRIVNVRLDPDHIRKVRALREKGVVLSDLVREAIDARYDAAVEAEGPRDMVAVIQGILERYPDPPDLPGRDYDVHDRREARGAIRRRLTRERS